jgi:hypothetical protein
MFPFSVRNDLSFTYFQWGLDPRADLTRVALRIVSLYLQERQAALFLTFSLTLYDSTL